MRLLEHFVSINGEGIYQGYPTLFLRFAGCNLSCGYCDTPYSHDPDQGEELSVIQVADIVEKLGIPRVTITGGEPLLQKDLPHLINMLVRFGHHVEIETNGSLDITIIPPHDRVTVTMDYKTDGSGMEQNMYLKNLEFLRPIDCLKFVVGSIAEIDKAFRIRDAYKLKCTCILSPIFDKILPKDIVDYVIEKKRYEFKVQMQIHKIIWPPEMRGV